MDEHRVSSNRYSGHLSLGFSVINVLINTPMQTFKEFKKRTPYIKGGLSGKTYSYDDARKKWGDKATIHWFPVKKGSPVLDPKIRTWNFFWINHETSELLPATEKSPPKDVDKHE